MLRTFRSIAVAAGAALLMGQVHAAASVVTPVDVVASSTLFTVTASKLIDGSGMVGELHGGAWDTMWLKDGSYPVDTTATVTFDLGQTFNLTGALVWQYNSDIDYNRGVKDFYIKTSSDGIAFNTVGDLRTLSRANGGLIPAQLQSFTAQARFVQFDILSNFDAQWPWVGLSEVRFLATPVPEPTSYALMALGLAAIGMSARRRSAAQR